MIRLFVFVSFLIMFSGIGFGSIVSNIDKKEIELTTRFDGSKILVFGALTETKNDPTLIIELVGPEQDITIRKKSKVWGIWVKKDYANFEKIPSFYQINSTNLNSDKRSEIGNRKLEKYFFSKFRNKETATQKKLEKKAYFSELLRLKKNINNIRLFETEISVLQKKLFFSTIELPQKIFPGEYKVIISLLDENYEVVKSSDDLVRVSKTGIQKFLSFNAANNSTFYGIFSVMLALFLGFSAAQIFRLLKL